MVEEKEAYTPDDGGIYFAFNLKSAIDTSDGKEYFNERFALVPDEMDLENPTKLIALSANNHIFFAEELHQSWSFLDFVNKKVYEIEYKGEGYGSADDAESFSLYRCEVRDYVE